MLIKKKIPNALTITRLLMSFVIPVSFFLGGPLAVLITYGIGMATDLFDGKLARKWNVESPLGHFIDPIADKLLNFSTLLITTLFVNPILIPILGAELFIANSTRKRTNNLLGIKHINLRNMDFIKRVKTKIDTMEEINVSILGKGKSCFIFPTVIFTLLSSFIKLPILSELQFISLALSVLAEIPVVIRYKIEEKISERKFKLDNNKYGYSDISYEKNKLLKEKETIKKFDKFDNILYRRILRKKEDYVKIYDNKEETLTVPSDIKESDIVMTEDKNQEPVTYPNYYNNYYGQSDYKDEDLGIARTKNIHHK
jgi:phosphatidylglycerophosphate synthase